MVSEGGTGGWDGRWEFGFVEFFFGRGVVLFGDDVVDRLLHGLFLFLFMQLIFIDTSFSFSFIKNTK